MVWWELRGVKWMLRMLMWALAVGAAEEGFFEQAADHWDAGAGTFRQRFFEAGAESAERVVLYVGGELRRFGEGDFGEVLGQELGARVVSLEHRFFGESRLSNETGERLELLTVEQAVEDAVAFRKWYGETRGNASGLWVVVGERYGGGLAAFLRSEHGEDFAAAVAVSGTVLAKEEYGEFDLQTAVSMGHECASVVRKAMREIESILERDGEWLRRELGAEEVEDDEVLFRVSEVLSRPVGEGRVEAVCGRMVQAHRLGGDLVEEVIRMSRGAVGESGETARDWMRCNQFRLYQTYPNSVGVRSARMTKEFFDERCADEFPEAEFEDVEAFNARHGGLLPKGTRIIYTTTTTDPWKWAGVSEATGVPKGCVCRTIIGGSVGAGAVLRTPTPEDPVDLVHARTEIIRQLKEWLKI